jgi:hypothetical protein
MNPATIIRQAKSEGLVLSLSESGGIKFEGNQQAAEKWKPVLREHKAGIVEALSVAANDSSPAFWKWLIHFAGREPVEVTFSPEATHAEVLELYPAAEPVPDARQSLTPLTGDEEAAIRGWLESIGETDPAIVAETLERCQRDSGAQGYFLNRANPEPFDREAFEERAGICEFDGGLSREKAEAIAWNEDNRRCCAHCLNLMPNGICKVAAPGGPVHARQGYQPNPDWLHRCPAYRPCPDDPDRRTEQERWPGLRCG